jgi:transposase InsO family protein
MILTLIDEAVADGARLRPACEVLGLSVRTIERWREQDGGDDRRYGPKSAPPNKLSPAEQCQILNLVNAPKFRDLSPNQIVPRLADEGTYFGSESTFYRLLREHQQLAHRQPSRPPSSRRPREHVATGPCQVWSWDITYLNSPVRGIFFYLYMIEDIWSRKILGWQVHPDQSAEHAACLFCETCEELGIDPQGIVFHADNGGPMKGSTMLATLQRLGVVPSFSRPRVCDDNPYSEALFRTMKYRPEYPSQPFASLEEARAWVAGFVAWYNTEHLHSAIRFVTPDDRHFGRQEAILENRKAVYEQARRRHPERWAGATRNWTPVDAVQLNPERRPTEKADLR